MRGSAKDDHLVGLVVTKHYREDRRVYATVNSLDLFGLFCVSFLTCVCPPPPPPLFFLNFNEKNSID